MDAPPRRLACDRKRHGLVGNAGRGDRDRDRQAAVVTGVGGPASIRPSGLAVGPDGSLYVAADANGTIWRILGESNTAHTREGK